MTKQLNLRGLKKVKCPKCGRVQYSDFKYSNCLECKLKIADDARGNKSEMAESWDMGNDNLV